MVDLPKSLVIGAGAGSSHFVGVNCELMPNMVASEGGVNKTFATKTVQNVSGCVRHQSFVTEWNILV